MTTTVPSAQDAADTVHELLDVAGGVTVFRGRVGDLDLGEDGTVNAYAVAYYGAGAPRVTRLGGRARNLSWTFQVTCAGGDDVKALWCIDQVRSRLTGARVEVGTRTGVLAELGDPGLLRPDRKFTPERYYLPLDFGLYL